MKQIIIIITIGCFTTGLFAQSKRASRVSPWDSLYFKHEISLDVSPGISGLLDGDLGDGESVGITYRLFFHKRNAFRASYRSTFDFYDQQPPSLESIGYRPISPGRTDSVIVTAQMTSRDERTIWHTLRAGYEHRFGKRRLKAVLGIDIITGVQRWDKQYSTYIYEATLPNDTSGAWHSFYYNPYSALPTYYYGGTVWSFVLGFTPVFGLNLNLTKRWSLNGSISYDIFGYFPFKYDENNFILNSQDKEKGIYGYGEAPMTDLSVTYHFGR